MAVKKIALMGESVLRQVAKSVPPKDITTKEIQTLIDDMVETALEELEGGFTTVGLAAPQVFESLRIFLAIAGDNKKDDRKYDVYINPEIEYVGEGQNASMESCVSTPRLCGEVRRYKKIKVAYLDREGKKQRKKLDGFRAVVVQHEYDHIEGILWIDKVTDTKTITYC